MSDDVKLIMANEHGLDAEHARFLVGTSVDELERSAIRLKQLLGERESEEHEPPFAHASALFATAETKAERKRALRAVITGRAPQPRDERGRFTSSGFDGGAREPAQTPRNPEREHDRWLLDALASRRVDAGARF